MRLSKFFSLTDCFVDDIVFLDDYLFVSCYSVPKTCIVHNGNVVAEVPRLAVGYHALDDHVLAADSRSVYTIRRDGSTQELHRFDNAYLFDLTVNADGELLVSAVSQTHGFGVYKAGTWEQISNERVEQLEWPYVALAGRGTAALLDLRTGETFGSFARYDPHSAGSDLKIAHVNDMAVRGSEIVFSDSFMNRVVSVDMAAKHYSTLIGNPRIVEPMPATAGAVFPNSTIANPSGVAFGPDGNVCVAENVYTHRRANIWQIVP